MPIWITHLALIRDTFTEAWGRTITIVTASNTGIDIALHGTERRLPAAPSMPVGVAYLACFSDTFTVGRGTILIRTAAYANILIALLIA